MSSPDALIAWLKPYLGTTENPPGSNKQPFAALAGHANGQPWCMTALVAGCKQTGVPVPDSASTRIVWAELQRQGRRHNFPRRGDFIFFDWPGGKTPTDHVGIVVEVRPDGWLITYEGNTSPDNNGSQSNGGGMFRRLRSATDNVRGFARPDYPDERPGARPAPEKEPTFMAALTDDEQRLLATQVGQVLGIVSNLEKVAHRDIDVLQPHLEEIEQIIRQHAEDGKTGAGRGDVDPAVLAAEVVGRLGEVIANG